jgi:hypothetical protein
VTEFFSLGEDARFTEAEALVLRQPEIQAFLRAAADVGWDAPAQLAAHRPRGDAPCEALDGAARALLRCMAESVIVRRHVEGRCWYCGTRLALSGAWCPQRGLICCGQQQIAQEDRTRKPALPVEAVSAAAAQAARVVAPPCRCGRPMVKVRARVGLFFWGCPRFGKPGGCGREAWRPFLA